MINDLLTNTGTTLLLTYAVNNAIYRSPLVNNRWLPIITLFTGSVIGVVVGSFIDPNHLTQNIVSGAIGGSMATWLANLVEHTILNKGELPK